ncbi:hypothetical protein IQ270_26590 [Microcoleus sp. LEGE 07076]|uniref:hypothetical protein n=1 Tax=Microcoleus sp. LEGE 07076 TaxID=915322 RepID=UPI00187E5423|nr:hypothetical protein [Microcoleus sp. LEGE 07076]MBE9188108.1 hypothetical protein [Microcoleus sp. LEGE 07076]
MPTKDEIDDLLKQLAIAAKNYPAKTLGRQQAVTKFMREIDKYKIVNCPRNTNFSPENYRKICAEARPMFLLRICREIHNYRPENKVSQWLNFLMVKCFQEATPKVIGRRDLPTLYYGDMELIFNQMEKQQLQNESYQIGPALLDLIAEDPGDIFQGEAMKKYPHVNFKFLLVKIVIEDESWQHLSNELGVSVSSLSSFYQRCLERFAPRFREYL